MNIADLLRPTLMPLFMLMGCGVAATAEAIRLHGLTAQNSLTTFDSTAPGKATPPVAITGLQAGETIVGIDVRPATGVLYGVGSAGRLYTLNPDSGAATLAGPLAADPTDATLPFSGLSGTAYGVDFNPVPDRLRVTSTSGINLRINPANGNTLTDGALNPGTPNIVASAYTNSDNDPATGTTLYGIDSNSDALMLQNPPNDGTLAAVGPLGVDVTDNLAFDIAGPGNYAFAGIAAAGQNASALYTLNLTTGAATLVGEVKSAGVPQLLRGLAISLTGNFIGLTTGNRIVTFEATTPGILNSSVPVTGLQEGETLQGIDIRPANGAIYGVGSTGRLYTVNPVSGAATLTGALTADPTDTTAPFTTLSGTAHGVDFNPVPDRLRVTSTTGLNLRINPTNGVTTTDGALNPGAPSVVASAYTNSDNDPATGTTLYGIDSASDSLVIQNPPNDGTLATLGLLGLDASENVGFDMVGPGNAAFAAIATTGAASSGLYSINLANGSTSLIAAVGAGGNAALLRGLTVAYRPLRGDVNSDGQANVIDALLILRHVVGLVELTAPQLPSADLDANGNVTISDAILILRLAMGLD